jgi:hypothetical protein
MSSELMITTVVTITLAFIGYLITYLNNLRLSQRAERIQRVNRQLAELYGPLFAMSQASKIAYHAFRSANRPQQAYFDVEKPPNEKELEAWRLWMTTVFMPVNLRMYELMLSKSDLLIEAQMPEGFLSFCAHVTAYQAVMKKWENNDFSEHRSLVNHPRKLLEDYLDESFRKLKTEQEALLGKNKRHQSQKSESLVP